MVPVLTALPVLILLPVLMALACRSSPSQQGASRTASGSGTEQTQGQETSPPQPSAAPQPSGQRAANQPENAVSNTKLVEVKTVADIKATSGQVAAVVGTYVEVDVRKRQSEPPVYKGHAAVRLADGTMVFLSPAWSQDAIRPREEIDAYKDKQVAVLGVVVESCPPDPSGGASLIGPCVTMVMGVDRYEQFKQVNDTL